MTVPNQAAASVAVPACNTKPYVVHLPAGVDLNASYWHLQSHAEARNPLQVVKKAEGQATVLQLDVTEPVCLSLAQSGSTGVTALPLGAPGCYAVQLEATAHRILNQPILLVSDLDDTLIGHTAAMDEGTREFNSFWRASAAAGPSKLVYNTGRTLPLYEQVWAKKQHCLPPPDALVCGVGTRIYYPSEAGTWEEDQGWTARMDEGWSYEDVRQVLDSIIADHGDDKVHYRTDVELHRHKQTVMVREELVMHVTAELLGALSHRAVQAVLITGGIEPEWRFIDVVPLLAGKGAALKYLRDRLGFQERATVAAGDSANDYLMLEASQNAVVVANCVPELREWVRLQKPVAQVLELEEGEDVADGQQSAVPVAAKAEGKVVVLASRPGSRGVLQGLALLGFT